MDTIAAERLEQLPSEDGSLFEIAAENDPTQQMEQLMRYSNEHSGPAAAESLADFARNPESSPATLVRLNALAYALAHGYGKDVISWPPETSDIVMEATWPDADVENEDFRYTDRAIRYIYAISRLAEHEQVDGSVFDPASDVGSNYDWAAVSKSYPVRACIFLDRVLFAEPESPEEKALFDEFRPLATEVNRQLKDRISMPELADRPLNDWGHVSFYSQLTKFGAQHSEHMAKLIDRHDETMTEYLEKLMYMYSESRTIARSFPDEVSQGVEEGIGQLTADALYAIIHHIENGDKTDVIIPLSDQLQLPFRAEGDDIKNLLDYFTEATKIFNGRSVQPHFYGRTAFGGFQLEPAVPVDEDAAYYPWAEEAKGYTFVRSRERDDFDRTREYAGEISINHVLDQSLAPDEEIEIGPHSGDGPDNRLSIRVDLERRGSWTGQLSVDVGSLLGDDEWPGVKLARLLAWGNMLRCQREGEEPVYSHMRYHFSQPAPVDPAEFGQIVQDYRKDLEFRQQHPDEPAQKSA